MSQTESETFPQLDNEYANLTVNQTLVYGDVTLDHHAATKWYVDQEIKDLVSGAPDTLDTLKEIVEFIGDQNVSLDIVTRLSAAESSREEISEALHSEISKVTERINIVSGELFTEISGVETRLDSLSAELSNTTHDLRTEIEQVSSALSTEVGALEGKISQLSTNVTVQIEGEVDKLETLISESLAGKLDDGRVTVPGDMVVNKIYGTSITDLPDHQEIVKIVSNDEAFAFITKNGHVKSWGGDVYGGNGSLSSPGVIYNPNGDMAVQIVSNAAAFAFITKNGHVWTTGVTSYGGSNNSNSLHHLYDPKGDMAVQIVSNLGAFAFITENGHVWTTGDTSYGGSDNNDNGLYHLYKETDITNYGMAVQIVGNQRAFAFITKNGYVKTTGKKNYGGSGDNNDLRGLYNPSEIQYNGDKADQIVSNLRAFAFITKNGNVKTTGQSSYGGSNNSNSLHHLYDPDGDRAVQIVGNYIAFAFITENGHVKTTGYTSHGGSGGNGLHPLYSNDNDNDKAVQIIGNFGAFAFITEKGYVKTTGQTYYGGSGGNGLHPLYKEGDITNYGKAVQIVGNWGAFAFITEKGNVKTTGYTDFGGSNNNDNSLHHLYKETDITTYGKVVQIGTIMSYNYNHNFWSRFKDAFVLYVNETQQVERYRKMSPSRGGHFQVDERDAYLYIGNHWRIAANNNFENDGKKRLVFEYNQYDPVTESVSYDLLSSWITGVPFIEN